MFNGLSSYDFSSSLRFCRPSLKGLFPICIFMQDLPYGQAQVHRNLCLQEKGDNSETESLLLAL